VSFPVVLFWLLIMWGIVARGPVLFYLYFALGAFGSIAIVPPELVAGSTLLPQPICAAVLFFKLCFQPGALNAMTAAAADFRRLAWLTLFVLVAIATAFIMPRLFAGVVDIIPVRFIVGLEAQPLGPTTTNITQSVYLVLSFSAALTFYRLLRSEEARRTMVKAQVLGGAILILTGLIDMFAGASPLVAPFRTAAYALATNAEIAGAKRVVGLMPEASAFGAACLSAAMPLYFFRRILGSGLVKSLALPAVLAGLLVMAALSTSSTAYAGLAVFGALAAANWIRRAWNEAGSLRRPDMIFDALIAVGGLLAFLTAWALNPTVLAPVFNMVDAVVLQKSATSSYAERNLWTQVSFDSIFSTYGLGVGLGSTRASNWFVAILSNTGVLGAGFIAIFLVQGLLCKPKPRLPPEHSNMVTGLKLIYSTILAMGALAGTTADFGAGGGLIFGLLVALTERAKTERKPALARRWRPPELRRNMGAVRLKIG
jgi:hypothetical protein